MGGVGVLGESAMFFSAGGQRCLKLSPLPALGASETRRKEGVGPRDTGRYSGHIFTGDHPPVSVEKREDSGTLEI